MLIWFGEQKREDRVGSFSRAKVWKRILIVAAGAIINIIFAIILFFSISIPRDNISTKVSEIIPECEENLVGLEIDDEIIKIEGKKIHLKSDITRIINSLQKEELVLTIKRENEIKDIKVKTTLSEGVYYLGIAGKLADSNIKNNLYYAFWETNDFVLGVLNGFKMLFTGNVSINQFTGPIGISEYIVKTDSVYKFFYLMSLISISLGITNLLPFPALDGGRIVLLIIEGIRKKPIEEELELKIQALGFSLLICLSIYISVKDVFRIFIK